jgi:S1-C subfamily serine protease
VNALDLVILALAIGAGIGGYRLGLVARATSWLGMLVGILAAARAVGPVARAIEGAGDSRLLLAAAGLLVGGAFLGQAIGLLIGARLHYALPAEGPARQIDRSAGGVVGVLGVLVAVWLLTPALAEVRGETARLARSSTVTRFLADALPQAPDALGDLEDLVGGDFPSVFSGLDPAPDLGPPPPETGLTPEVQELVARSTVKVEAAGCGRLQDGSGVVLGPGLIMTNAHVVAGGDEVVVERHPDGDLVEAEVVAFDPSADLAVLSVPGIDRPPLPMGDAEAGSVGAVFGHPGGGPLTLSPYLVGEEVTATGRDIYGSSQTRRQVLFLAAELAPGDSGAALVDAGGNVVGIAFAIAPDQPQVAYALTIEEVQAVLAGPLAPTDTGPCVS